MASNRTNNCNIFATLFTFGFILSTAFSQNTDIDGITVENSTETATVSQNVVNATEGPTVNATEGPTLIEDTGVWFGIYKNSNGTIDDRQRLINDLLSSRYDTRNYPTNLTVELGVSFLSLNLDGLSRRNTFQTEVLLRKLWIDPRLQWNASEYGGHSVISIPNSQVWKPDIALLNSASNPTGKACAESNVLVASDGQVLWVSPCQFLATCDLSGDDSGRKVCPLLFGSWAWAGTPMDLQFYKNETEGDFTFFTENPDIYVRGSRAVRLEKEYGFFSETFPVKIRYDIAFARKSPGGPSLYSASVTGTIGCANGARAGKDGTCADQAEF